MNAKRKLKAVQDFVSFAQLENEELIAKLVEAGYDEEKEVPEIIAELKGGRERSFIGIKEPSTTHTKRFNLSELNETEDEDGQIVFTKCENWEHYQKAVEKMDGSKMVDFIKVNAVGCFRTVINARGDKVHRLVGIKLLKEKPLHKTRIDIHTANRLNDQILNPSNLTECSIYYLVESLINY